MPLESEGRVRMIYDIRSFHDNMKRYVKNGVNTRNAVKSFPTQGADHGSALSKKIRSLSAFVTVSAVAFAG